MSYKITLEVYVNEKQTVPTIQVESIKGFPTAMDTAALERDLTRTREFSESLVRNEADASG